MARYVPDHSSQTLFIDGSLDSLLPTNSMARSIRHGLGELAFRRFDAVYRNDLEGRPAIDPRCLTGLWILALLRGVTSSVQVARWCRTDIEFRWLRGDAHVQKSTLSAFRSDHREALADLSTHLLTRPVVTEGAIGRLVGLLHWRRCCPWGRAGAKAEARWRQISYNLMLYLGLWRPLVSKPIVAGP